jgi:hypothetical protein
LVVGKRLQHDFTRQRTRTIIGLTGGRWASLGVS